MNEPVSILSGHTGKGSLVQRLRLWSGLVLLVYVTLHFINHSLGHVSLVAMERMLGVISALWKSLPGMIALYGALLIHTSLGVWKIISIRTLKRPAWEWIQMLLGVAIPYWLVTHIIFTRVAESRFGFDINYASEFALLWPWVAVKQNLLLLIVWTHGMMGLHFWLRLKPWFFPRVFAYFLAVATIVPVISITGWLTAARLHAERISGSPGKIEKQQEFLNSAYEALLPLNMNATSWIAALGLLMVSVIGIRFMVARLRTHYRVDYGDGKIVNITPGQTILDASRNAGIPHMSVCGGRARCSTCRTLVISGLETLSARTEAEDNLLNKINAGADIRLACQARIHGDVELRPLIQPQQQLTTPHNADPLGWGVEREVAILFLDIRGFSKISEQSLPYDIVFILNSFFAEVTSEIEAANGYVDKFMGDGLMAIFGLATDPRDASRDALRAAVNCQKATIFTSRILTQHLDQPIRIGVGIHTGNVIIGRIGKTSDQTSPSRLTAVGDSVNVAARLESATKELKSEIVFSDATFRLSGLRLDADIGERSSIKVHNISALIDIIAIKQHESLAAALDNID